MEEKRPINPSSANAQRFFLMLDPPIFLKISLFHPYPIHMNQLLANVQSNALLEENDTHLNVHHNVKSKTAKNRSLKVNNILCCFDKKNPWSH